MMGWVHSSDGTTIDSPRRVARPERVWRQDGLKGRWVSVESDADANAGGWYELVETPRPSPDHARTIKRIGDRFETVWTFDQTRADAREAGEADQAEREQARRAVTALRAFVDNPNPNGRAVIENAKLQNRALIRLIRDTFG